jgi:hypothetical protein
MPIAAHWMPSGVLLGDGKRIAGTTKCDSTAPGSTLILCFQDRFDSFMSYSLSVMPSPLLCRLFLLLLPGMLLCSCSATNHLLKARPCKLSPFFEHANDAVNTKGKLPFQKVWVTKDSETLAAGRTVTKLYIAPVSLDHLRPIKKVMARQEARWGTERREAQMAIRLREEFERAFLESPAPVYQLADKPGKDTLTLQLAITDLNPTSPRGNLVLTVAKFAVTPLAGFGRLFTSGNMAIEGKLTVPGGQNVFFEFADNEADKLTFLNARDLLPYGHAEHSMRDWAVQFEQMTRKEKGLRLKDSSAVTLKLH